MELKEPLVPADANPRIAMGGNMPPPEDALTAMQGRAREYVAAGSAWINELPAITTQAQADAAGAYIRQGSALVTEADKTRKAITDPMRKQVEKIKSEWDGAIAPAVKARTLVQEKLTAFFIAEDERQKAEAAAAAKAAAEAEAAAIAAAEKAFELHDKAKTGELAGSGTNTVQAMADAEAAQAAAAAAADEAERLASQKVQAGGQYSVNGIRRSVSLRTKKRLVLDLPANAPKGVVAIALGKLLTHIVKDGNAKQFDEIKQAIGKVVNQMYDKTGVVPAGCKEVEERKAV